MWIDDMTCLEEQREIQQMCYFGLTKKTFAGKKKIRRLTTNSEEHIIKSVLI